MYTRWTSVWLPDAQTVCTKTVYNIINTHYSVMAVVAAGGRGYFISFGFFDFFFLTFQRGYCAAGIVGPVL